MVSRSFLIVSLLALVSACTAPVTRPPQESHGEPPPAVVPSQAESTPASATAGLLAQAEIAMRGGDFSQAEALLQRAQRIDSQNALVYLALSRLYSAQGQRQPARSMAERGMLYCRETECDALREELQ